MSIKAGERMPEGKFKVMSDKGPQDLTTKELFDGKRVVLFSVPGAFTPTCDAKHLPGYLQLADKLRAKGVDTIACMAVNDVFVMNALGKAMRGQRFAIIVDKGVATHVDVEAPGQFKVSAAEAVLAQL